MNNSEEEIVHLPIAQLPSAIMQNYKGPDEDDETLSFDFLNHVDTKSKNNFLRKRKGSQGS